MYAAVLLCMGIGLLLSGLICMRFGLNKVLSKRIKHIFAKMTVTPWRGLIVGIFTSAILQSSTAVSLITIGLVSAEYLTFYQSLGIILGANIGTCTTVQLLAISIPNEWLVPLLIGCILAMVCKKSRYQALAAAGLISMFLGLTIIANGVTEISEGESMVQNILIMQKNPFYGIIGGIVVTLLFQSSSAATGVLIVMAEKGLIDITAAAYVVYGNNIGSCLSSLIVGAASPLAAKRVAAAHIMLNILGVLAFLPFTNVLTICTAAFSSDFAGQIALMHTIFNILCSILLMPFIKQYAKLIMVLVPQ